MYPRLAAASRDSSENFRNRCSILKIIRTHFAACGGEEAPRKNSERRRSRTADNFKFFFGGILL